MSDISKQFLQNLKDYNETKLTKDIYVPSLETKLKFKPLTAKQQKLLIDSALDNPIINISFMRNALQIIKELCEESHLIENITVYDRDAILIQMYYHFINEEYNDKDISENIKFIESFKEDFTPTEETVGNFKLFFKKI